MLGIPDPSIWLAYLVTLGGALLCIIYGVANWNKDDNTDNGSEKK